MRSILFRFFWKRDVGNAFQQLLFSWQQCIKSHSLSNEIFWYLFCIWKSSNIVFYFYPLLHSKARIYRTSVTWILQTFPHVVLSICTFHTHAIKVVRIELILQLMVWDISNTKRIKCIEYSKFQWNRYAWDTSNTKCFRVSSICSLYMT